MDTRYTKNVRPITAKILCSTILCLNFKSRSGIDAPIVEDINTRINGIVLVGFSNSNVKPIPNSICVLLFTYSPSRLVFLRGYELIVIEESKGGIHIRKANIRDLREAAYMLISIIPIGKVTTYKSVAEVLGLHPRVIARFMALNDKPLIIPCHRVVMSNGGIGGYSRGGSKVKEELLRIEGVSIINGKVSGEHIVDIEELLRDPK